MTQPTSGRRSADQHGDSTGARMVASSCARLQEGQVAAGQPSANHAPPPTKSPPAPPPPTPSERVACCDAD